MTASINTNAAGELETLLRGSVAFKAGRGLAVAEAMRPGPESVAVATRRMRLAAEPFIGHRAAKHVCNTVAGTMVLEPGADIFEAAISSLTNLQRGEEILGDSPVVAKDADLAGCATAIRLAWCGS